MKLGVLNQHADTGGVETFLLSLLPRLRDRGHEVELLCLDDPQRGRLLPELRARGIPVARIGDAVRRRAHRLDALMVTNPATLCRALRALDSGQLQAERCVVGVYQTRMFCLDRGPLNLHNRLARRLLGGFEPANVIFGNEACRAEHARWLPRLAASPVIPLIVDVERFARRPPLGRTGPLRIVSVGHLLPFKSYNRFVPELLRRLVDEGHDLVWDIYGEGPLEAPMRRRAAELALGDRVVLHGALPYPALPRALAGAFAFVGSGLSLMEAAASGVPAIAAIEYANRPESYGFVQDIEGISLFEPGLPWPRHDIGELLLRLLGTPPPAYEAIGDAGRDKMRSFSGEVVAPSYEQALLAAGPRRPPLGPALDALQRGSATVHALGRHALATLGARDG